MDEIQALAGRCRVAKPSDSVVHSECAFTFYTPFSEMSSSSSSATTTTTTTTRGILVNLNTFAGTIQELAMKDAHPEQEKDIFLRIIKDRVETMNTDGGASAVGTTPAAAPTKLAIGGEGGFATDDDKYEDISKHSIVVLNKSGEVIVEVEYDENTKPTFPESVVNSVESIIHHVGLAVQQDLAAWQDDEEIPVSKYCQDLPFVDNGVKISPDPKDWKCEKSGATDNLWLNLSDGFIGGGRKHWDGSGGSNGAVEHFEETGQLYPLVVKLGTITSEGNAVQADCYSYAKDEDGPVKIPNLEELLAKRGIQVAGLQKTVKSTAELEVELNANFAFDAITESGTKLVPVSGPGLQGLQNLGNSCYLNSVVQAMAALPEFAKRYGTPPDGDVIKHANFDGVKPSDAPYDLTVQTTKLVSALTSGKYSIPSQELDLEGPTHPKYRVAPRMFKHVIGKDHVEFRTEQQQDAAQFLQYLMEQLDGAEVKKDSTKLITSSLFAFETEDRLVCSFDQGVKYNKHAPTTVWTLRVPMEKAKVLPKVEDEPETKKQKQEGEEEEKQIPHVSFHDCTESWAAESVLDDYRWPHLQNAVQLATQTTKFHNFPRYLWVQIQRYELGPDWQPFKLEVNLDIPENIDLSMYRSKGPQEGENLIPEEGSAPAAPSKPTISEAALGQLMDMGFSMNGCKRALTTVGGSDVEAAMNWIFEHNGDPDFNDPLPEDAGAPAAASNDNGVDDGVVMSLVENLGCFTFDQVRAALKETKGAADRAADWLFSHMDDLDTAIASLEAKNNATTTDAASKIVLEDGEGKYNMVAMVSHIGKNTGSGHYVAHIKRDGKWIIFNDQKVAISENPPLEHAYLYLFQRSDTIGSPNKEYN